MKKTVFWLVIGMFLGVAFSMNRLADHWEGAIREKVYSEGYSDALDKMLERFPNWFRGPVVLSNGASASFSNALFIIQPARATAIDVQGGPTRIEAGSINVFEVRK